ncbi:MAG: NADH-quinone oxidoreductase subunit L [Myxococcota bacterium]
MVAFTLFAPLIAFAVLALIPPLRHAGRLAGVLSSAVAIACFGVATWLLWTGHVETFTMPWLVAEGKAFAHVGWRLDAVSAPMLVVVTLVSACVQVYSLGYLSDEPGPALGRYFAWHSLFVFSMVGLVLAPELLQLVACWELVGLCSYLLIGFWWSKPSAGRAAVKAVWVTRFADMGLLSGTVLLCVTTGGFSWDSPAPAIVAALLFVGVMGKSAQMPLHVWLPDAMEGPTPVSALLHAATMVAAGVYLVVRCWPLFAGAPDVLLAMQWIGAITAFLAACVALVQNDVKKVLAYSTCSQLGYMVAGLGSGAMLGGYFHLVTHASFKALLFLAAGSIIHAVHTNDVREMGGLARKIPVTAALFALGVLALAGFPGLAGFFSKDLVLEELLHAHAYGPLVLLLAGAGLTAFYMTRVFCMAFLGEPRGHGHPHESPLVMLVPMGVLAIPAALSGYAVWTFAGGLGLEYHFAMPPVAWAATLLGLGGIGLAYARFGLGMFPGLGWEAGARFLASGPVDGLYVRGWQLVLLPFARVVGWVDRYVVDGLMNVTAWAALEAGERIRAIQTGQVRDYVYAVAVGVVLAAAYGATA